MVTYSKTKITIFVFLCMGVIHLLQPVSAFALAKRPELESEAETKNAQSVPVAYSLLKCFQVAFQRSETVAIQKEEIEATEADIFQAMSEIFGDVDFVMTDFRQQRLPGAASAGGSSSSDSFASFSTRDHQRERKFVITQPLFQGFRSIATLGAAGSLRKQRTREWQRAQELLFLDVSNAFYNVLKFDKEVVILQETLKSLEERVQELDAREEIGRSRPSEVASALSRKKIIESELAAAEGTLAVAHHILEFLIGMPVENLLLADEELPDSPNIALVDYLEVTEMRPDVEAAGYATKTAWRGVVEAQSGFWPEISLDANSYERREGAQKDVDWDMLFKVTVPLSRGGESIANLKRAFTTWKKAKLNQSLVKRQANLDVETTYRNWNASLKESMALEEAVKASQANFDLQKEEYSQNLVSNLDVLEALEELNNARRQANQSHYTMKDNYWKLQIATGQLYEYI